MLGPAAKVGRLPTRFNSLGSVRRSMVRYDMNERICIHEDRSHIPYRTTSPSAIVQTMTNSATVGSATDGFARSGRFQPV